MVSLSPLVKLGVYRSATLPYQGTYHTKRLSLEALFAMAVGRALWGTMVWAWLALAAARTGLTAFKIPTYPNAGVKVYGNNENSVSGYSGTASVINDLNKAQSPSRYVCGGCLWCRHERTRGMCPGPLCASACPPLLWLEGAWRAWPRQGVCCGGPWAFWGAVMCPFCPHHHHMSWARWAFWEASVSPGHAEALCVPEPECQLGTRSSCLLCRSLF
jgi:hypothetical protein